MRDETTVGRGPLLGQYALHFATVGILLPFLPAYLTSLTLSATDIGLLLAIGPAMAIVAPQLFGHVTDRRGRPDHTLRLITLGAAVGFAPLAFVREAPTIALVLAAYTFFSSSMTGILDALALQRVAHKGESFARIRLFGSAGFVVSSVAFGLAVSRVDRRTILVPLALMLAASLWSFSLRARTATALRPFPFQGLALLARRDVALLLLCCALHWIALAPYHGTFAIHVAALGLPPSVVGLGAGLGVLAEIGVMALHPWLARRLEPRHVLGLAFLVSAARWWGMSVATSATAIVALCLLHGMTFGAFYAGAVETLGARVPPTLRASGQSLFVSITFGVGGLVGYVSAGVAYDALGGSGAFAAAGVLELLVAVLVVVARI
jgi:PPP family 3-phenylpropionic acid transporter